MKDIDKLNKYELLKLLKKKSNKKKKKVNAKKTKTKKTYSISRNPTMSDNMVQQKPIISQTNPQQGRVQSIFGSTASIDQRNNDILRGQMNETANKLITATSDLKKVRTKPQLQGDKDKSNTFISKGFITGKREANHDFRTLGEQKMDNTMKNVFKGWKKVTTDNKNSIAVDDHSIDRETHEDTDYFNPDDAIDVPTTSGELDDAVDDDEDNVEIETEIYNTDGKTLNQLKTEMYNIQRNIKDKNESAKYNIGKKGEKLMKHLINEYYN